jgi:hypothetical protein
MRDVLGISGPDHTEKLADGRRVHAPIYSVRMAQRIDGVPFSADFLFDQGGSLITEQSWHTRHWQRVTTAEDKERLTQARKVWAPYLDLMMYRLPEFEASCSLEYKQGRPFSSTFIPYKDTKEIQDMHNRMMYTTGLPDTAQIDAFMRLGQAVFDSIASRRAHAQDDFQLKHPWGAHGTNFDTYDKLTRPVTAHQLRKSVSNKLEQIINLKIKTGYVEIPQFVAVDSMPSGYRAVSENPFN